MQLQISARADRGVSELKHTFCNFFFAWTCQVVEWTLLNHFPSFAFALHCLKLFQAIITFNRGY